MNQRRADEDHVLPPAGRKQLSEAEITQLIDKNNSWGPSWVNLPEFLLEKCSFVSSKFLIQFYIKAAKLFWSSEDEMRG